LSTRLHVFVLIDALGWSYLEGRDFLNDLLPYRQPLRTVLGYSSGAIPTILTGKPPAEHGHWNLFYYDPEHSPFRWLRPFGRLPTFVLENRLTRRALKEAGRRLLGLGPLFDCSISPRLLPWFSWTEKRNIYDRDGIVSGPSIFDRLAHAGVEHRVYTYHRYRDEETLQTAQRDLRAGGARFYFLYLSELDSFLHMHCDEPSRVTDQLLAYERDLRAVFQVALASDPGARMAVFSDHGMTPVGRHFGLVREVEALGYRMPEDYLAVYDSTMARFWFFSDRARGAILARLGSLAEGRVLADVELQKMGILFSDRRYGEVVFLLEPGCLLSGSDFNGSRWMPRGMHGYHPDDPYSHGIFLSSDAPASPLRSIADVHTYMQQALVS
jgi:hypothetical protein